MVRCMNTKLLQARRMSLALLIVAVVEHGNATIDCSGAAPSASGLVRLGRDLIRQAGGEPRRCEQAAALRPRSRACRPRWLSPA